MNCRKGAHLIAQSMEARLPLRDRVGLALHTLICGACRRFLRQFRAIDEALRGHLGAATRGHSNVALPDAAKERMRGLIREQLGGGD